MGETFEDRDLSDAVFWGVQMHRVLVRDADITDATFFHVAMRNVDIDGEIDRLVVNGVDVTAFVNEHDRWFPLRTRLSPSDADTMRDTWQQLERHWAALLERAAAMPAESITTSVNGEWSLRDTVRHLVFAIDKWFTWPLLGVRTFTALGLPNTGSQGFEWPGIDLSLDPPVGEVLALRSRQDEQIRHYLDELDLATLPEQADVLENGTVPAIMCLHVVFEEMFEHLRYALRDLEALAAGA